MSRTFLNARTAYRDARSGSPEEEAAFLQMLSTAQSLDDLESAFEQLFTSGKCLTTDRPKLTMLLARVDMMNASRAKAA